MAAKSKPKSASAKSAPKKSDSKKSATKKIDAELASAKATIKKLTSKVKDLEKSASSWEKKAKDLRKMATKKRSGSKKADTDWVIAPHPEPVESSADPVTDEAPTAPAASSTPASDTPDDSWNVTRLRAEARARGVAGYSRLSKEALLEALA